jgi:hypothetical protein
MTPPEANDRGRVLFTAIALGALALAALGAILVLGLRQNLREPGAATSEERPTREPSAARETKRVKAPIGRLFARKSVWNQRLPDSTPIDPASGGLVAALAAEAARELQAGIGPWIATTHTTTLYRVGPDQSRVRVRLDASGTKGSRALRRAFAAVPIPSHAEPAHGPDRHMTIWQPSTDTLWEFWKANREANGWHARWGGAIRRVSKSPGYYTPRAWRGATSNWGATASSLPVVAGTITLREIKRGRIHHALALNLPTARAGVFAWPAQRTDGVGPTTDLPEGARVRLDPSLDIAALQLPRFVRLIASAAQRYGMVVRDQTHQAISLFAENPNPAAGDPYTKIFAGKTRSQLLSRFPWDRLMVVSMHFCTQAPCRSR